MTHDAGWDWNPGERVLFSMEQCSQHYEWVEEFHPSVDGERVASVVKFRGEDSGFGVCVNGTPWPEAYDKAWYPQWSPDGRLTALTSQMGEWTVSVDGVAWPELFDFAWDTRFSLDGSRIFSAVQREQRYGFAVDGVPWETVFENATNPVFSSDGSTVAAVVQTRFIPQADIFTYKQGCYTVAVNEEAWDRNFVNCWTPVISDDCSRVACAARTSLYEYVIVVNGEPWNTSFQCIWKPSYRPMSRSLAAPVRLKGKWGVAMDGDMLWAPRHNQIWDIQFNMEGTKMYAVGAPRYGHWTVIIDDRPWRTSFRDMVTELTISPDGNRAALVGKDKGQYAVAVDDNLWPGWFDMGWRPVFSHDSRHVAVKVERGGGGRFTYMVNGRTYPRDFDQLWKPVFSPDNESILIRAVDKDHFIRIVAPISDFTG